MRITIEIDDKTLERVQQLTQQSKKSPAVADALAEYIRLKSAREFVAKVMEGKTDYSMTNDEIEALTMFDRQ